MKRFISLLLAVVMLVGLMPTISVSAADREIASVSITSDKWRLLPGEKAQLTAEGLNAAGEAIKDVQFSFVSMDESIAAVDNKGLVTAKAYGVIEVLVKATVGDVTIPKLVRLTVADPSDRETFDEMAPGTVPESFASGSTMAAVSDDAGKNSAMSAKLYDTSSKSAALLRYETLKSKELKLEFDVLTKSTAVQFRISNGARGTANTAFWIRINSSQVQYYDGTQVKWLSLGNSFNSIANKWASVRVEAAVGGAADVYVNGEYIGAVPRTGGDYSGNATAMIDSVVFEAGDAGTTGSLFYIDNLKLAPPRGADGETFDKLDLDATPESVDGYISHNAAVIKTAPGAAGNKALMLMGSKDNTAVPSFDYRFETAEKVTLEYDVYLADANNLITFQVYNTTKAYSNTVFFMQFNYLYGLRVYNGKWNALNADAKLMTREWNKIRLEITAGQDPEAKVYLNDEHVATTKVAYNKKDTVNGINFFVGTKEQTCYIDNLKVSAPVNQSFNDLEQVASPEVLDGYQDHYAAMIKRDPIKEGNALHLSDPSATKTPTFQYKFDSAKELALDFDVFIPADNTTVSFQIYNGAKSYSNSAFWMQFNYAYGLRAYADGADGKAVWFDPINKDAKLKPNEWNSVRIEMTTGENSAAKVYLNGTEIGTVTTPCKVQNSVNGFCIFPGSANMSCYLDNLKVTIAPHEEEIIPESVVEDFENVQMQYGSVEDLPGFKSYQAVTVQADPVKAGEKALRLYDDAEAIIPEFMYSVGSGNKLSLSFDINPQDNSSIALRALNGKKDNANTAFWLQFRHDGIYSYDGPTNKYQKFSDAVLKANEWNSVRIEMITGAEAEAVVYLNDAEVGKATKPSELGATATVLDIIYIQATKATQSFYVDNLKVNYDTVEVTPPAPPSLNPPVNGVVEENFEGMPAGTDLTDVFASGTTMVTVTDTKAKDSTKSAYMADTSTSSASILRMQTDKGAGLELDFDYYPVTGGLNFRLTNGGRTTANTAYWIGLANAKGADNAYHTYLRYYSGTAWVNVYEFAGTLANKWSSIHVEATAGGKAKVSVDGVEIGEVPCCTGSYGTNAATEMDSVVFEVGDSGTTTGKVYLDNLKLAAVAGETPPVEPPVDPPVEDSDVQTFENLAAGTDLATVYTTGTVMATVSEAKGKDSTKSAELADTSSTAAALLQMMTDKSAALELEFDYNPAVGGMNVRFTNGERNTANTAFWLAFNNKAVSGTYYTFLQYYNGSAWVDLYQFDTTLANKWTSIRVEAAANGNAVVYANGTKIGEAPRTGGSYGSAVTTEIDSAIFECGSAAATNGKVYLDNLKLVPFTVTEEEEPSTVQDFESLAAGTDLATVYTTGTVMATVSEAKGKDSTKSAELADTSSTAAALLQMMTDKSAALELEFDYNPAVGGMNVRFTNGERNTANTAFWLAFNNKAVSGTYYTFLQYYNGSAWVDLYQFDTTLANKWTSIRVEAAANGNAVVYANGTKIGEAPRTGGSYGSAVTTEIDSAIFECGSAAATNGKVYLDNLVLKAVAVEEEPPVEESGVVEQDFESLAAGTDLATVFASGTTMATVSEAKAKDSAKSAELADTSTTSAAILRVETEKAAALELDFDYNPAVGGLTFRLSNGGRNEANTAFWLGFANKKGADNAYHTYFQYHNGTAWVDVYEFAGTLANKWSSVHVEASVNGTAKVSVDGVEIGEASRCGGTYGTSATTEMDSVIFECGNAATTTGKLYLDNLKLAAVANIEEPVVVQQNFEELAAGTDLATVFASGTTMATVSEAKAKDSAKSAELADTSTTSAAILRVETEKAAALELDFDYNPAVGGLTFRLSNGGRSDANTAFFLGFANKKGADNAFHTYFQYHNGTAWVDVYEFAGTLANKWSSVHVEASVNGTAKVSVDGVEIGEASRCGGTYGTSATTEMDSVIFECGNAATTTGKLYLDNLKLAVASGNGAPASLTSGSLALAAEEPVVAQQDFEALAVGTDLATVLASGTTMATVSDAKGKDSTKSAELADISTTSAAILRMETVKSAALELDFDYNPAVGGLQVRLSNGGRNAANTGFWIGFVNRLGADSKYHTYFQYYSGSAWIDAYEFPATLANKWSAIHVEATAGDVAKVFVDGVKVGEVPHCEGDYGTNATTELDSAVFECGSASTTTGKVYLDNLKLTTGTGDDVIADDFVQTFEDVELKAAAPIELPGYVAHNAAAVKKEPAVEGNMAVYLSDSTAADVPHFFYTFDSYDELTLDFDVYPTDEANAVAFQLVNGERTNDNTAFWLQISAAGLRAYNGADWTVINADTKLTANDWNSVSVKLTTGDAAEAKIYVNGMYAGNTKIVCKNQATVDGVYLSLDNKAHSCYIDNLKVTPAPVGSDFEDMEVGSVPGAPFTDVNMTTVSDAKAKDSGKSIYMEDSIGNQVSIVRVVTDKSEAMTLEFDMMPVTGSVQFRISNGERTTANTGFWINFTNKSVDGTYYTFLQYYNGNKWVEVYQCDSTLAGKWHTVRVEASAGDKAIVYMDGLKIGEVPACGGSFGTNAKDKLDSVIFECGDSTYATWKYYLDNVMLANATEMNFNGLANDTSAETVSGCQSSYAAVVQTAPGAKDNHILDMMGSANNVAAPDYQYSFGTSYEKMTMEFEVYPLASGNTTNFWFYNGDNSEEKTAFALSFGPSGLCAYADGQQNVVNADAKLISGAWNTVVVELTAGENSEAKIYLNGEEVGVTNAACSVQDAINGFWIFTGSQTQSCYVDNLKVSPASYMEVVTPEPIAEDFEGLQMQASVETLLGYVGDNGATVKVDPANANNEVVYLFDSNAQKAPYFEYSFGDNSKVSMELDVYIPDAQNDIAFQIYKDSKTNTAFFLEFNHESGLRVNNGQWAAVNADAKLAANTWNKIRLDITAGDNAQAKIYLNGTEIGTTKVVSNKVDVVNGIYVCTGSATQSCYLDNLKISATTTETFNKLAVNETPEKLTGYVSHVATAIKSDPGVDKAVYLSDSTGKTVPYFSYGYDYHSELKLEFDAYIPSSSNTVSFRIFSGSSADANTAYWFEFSQENGLRVNDGQWSVINANAKLPTQRWNKICVEFTGGEDTEATVYLNGKKLGTTTLAMNKKDAVNGLYVCTGSTTQSCYIDDVKASGTVVDNVGGDEFALLETEMGELFDIADNTETEGLPEGDPIIKEDFRASFGVYGYTQIPNIYYDPDTDLVYVNYNRHRDTIVDHPFDSTRVYEVETLLKAQAGEQLQDDYVDMITEDSMFFTAMTKLSDGRLFFQNYPTYYLTDTTSTTYSWIVNTDGSWEKVEGVLTLPQDMCYEGPQPTTTWGRYGFTRCLIELDDGTLLGAMYGSYGAVMVESKDLGKTWTYRSTIADSALGLDQPYINTDGTDITWFEPGITRCADGSLLCVLRTWRNKPLYQCRSYDDGLTWTEPTLMPGMEGKSIYPQLQLLSNGVMALSTGVPGDTIYFSLDGCGYNWDYCITTYSGDTTGNSAITEVDYDEETGTVTLIAVGDRGFNNLSLSGVWGRVVKVTRNHIEDPKLASAIIRADDERMAPGESIDMRVETVFDSDSNVIGEGYTVEWYSLTPIIATMDQSGKLTAKNVGTAEVQAVVSYEGKMVMTNTVSVEIRERDVLDSIEVTPTKWVLKPGQKGSLTCEAFNYFGQEFVSGKITKQEYINGNINEPKFLDGDVKWTFESENPELLVVDPETGDYQALYFGTVDLVVTATKDDVTLVRKVTMIIQGNQWVMEDFESGEMPEGTIVTDYVSVSEDRSWSGKYSLCLDDDSTTLTPTIRYPLPESRGIIVEFMIFTESVEHSPTFGIGAPREDGLYNYLCNTVYIGLLNNPHTVAQGFQAFNGISWSYSNRANNIPHRQWNKVRLEVSTDKEARFYVNGKLLHQPAVAAEREFINTLFFGSGGAAYTGDTIYIDDIRYMTFDEPESAMSLTEQELVYENENFYIENEFYFVDVDLTGVDLSTDAGLLVWNPTQFAGRKVEYDDYFAIPGLEAVGDTGYYRANSKAIIPNELSNGAYYAGYVKLADGTYIYSDAVLYTPSTTQLNFISAAQQFLNSDLTKDDLANAKLTRQQREINWTELGRNLGFLKDMANKDLSDEQKAEHWAKVSEYMQLANEVPAEKQTEKDTQVFGKTGKTLQLAEVINLCSVYEIKADVISTAQESGTIFWTAEQFAALNGVPGRYNYGDGTLVAFEQYGDNADLWVSVGPTIAPEDMADTEYYMLGYVVDADGNVSYSGVVSYTVEQYIKNLAENPDTVPEMVEVVKSLFAYERAVRKSR